MSNYSPINSKQQITSTIQATIPEYVSGEKMFCF